MPDFDTMSSTEAQIQELAADRSSGIEEMEGPMPASGLEAFAPGAQVVAESHEEWMAEGGVKESVDEQVAHLIEDFDTPPSQEQDASGEGADEGPSGAAEEETGQETTDELAPEQFEGEEVGTNDQQAEGGESKTMKDE